MFTVNRATSLKFVCPGCRTHHIILPLQAFAWHVPWQRPKPTEPDTWKATGLTVYDITLMPSVHVDPGRGFHAMITNGHVVEIGVKKK